MVTRVYIEELANHIRKALRICPHNLSAYQQLVSIYTFKKDFAKASYCYLEAIKRSPAPSPCFYHLHFTLQAMTWFGSCSQPDLLEEGVLTLQKVTQKYPNFHFSKVVLGELLAQQGKTEEAIDCYKSASYGQTLDSNPQLVERFWDSNYSRKPDFLIVGFAKGGTTSLHSYLAAHPQVLPAVAKEIRYRSFSNTRTLDSYLAHFPSIKNNDYLTFEASPTSAVSPAFLKNISSSFPKIKLIVLLRNPVCQSISLFYQIYKFLNDYSLLSKHFEEDLISLLSSPSFMAENISKLKKHIERKEALENPLFEFWISPVKNNKSIVLLAIISSLYVYHLKLWLPYFSREQIFYVKSEDLFQEPEKTLNEVYSFLGLSAHSLPQYEKLNPGKKYSPISEFCQYQLAAFFKPYNQELEDYLGMKLDW